MGAIVGGVATTFLYMFWDGFGDVASADTVDGVPHMVAGAVYFAGIKAGGTFHPGIKAGAVVNSG